MRHLSLLLCLAGQTTLAQVDLPIFGPQQVINGYAKDITGEVIPYFSVYPEYATDALLTRCTDGRKAIAWETAAVPFVREPTQYFYFSWIAAHNSTTCGGDRAFDLYINDRLVLTFSTHHNTKPSSWSAAAPDSTKLVFEYSKMDRHGDAHGFAHLRVPRKYITLGEPLRLKVVGHAQQSPDWFMTFRYSFQEKIELKALPFVYRGGTARPLQITVLHFGGPDELQVYLGDTAEGRVFPVHNGLQVIPLAVRAPKEAYDLRVSCQLGREGEAVNLDTILHLDPVVPRDIYLVHHSHNDIGYSALQTEVVKIQNKNIYDALDLIDKTKDYPPDSRFKWNIESLWAVENFLGVASETDKQRFIAAVKSGSIALSANYANILTGLCTPEEMNWIVAYADSLRKWYGVSINTAMQTDVPGMSWSMVDAYANNGVRYLSQGPNYIPGLPGGGDRIGSTLREQGDRPYWWKGTTGKDSILVWTAGLGYSSWHGFTPGAIKERGTRKIADYMDSLTARGYPYSMVQWRYNIVSDNGPVDSTISDFVRDWNEKYSSPHLILANVNDMMQRFEAKYSHSIPTWSGDFTPYWEDGAYSTAAEEGNVRVLSARLSNLIDAAKILKKPIDPHLLYRAQRSIVLWHEHTWGAWNSISDPDDPEVIAQWKYKKAFADSAGWYVDRIEWALMPSHPMSTKLGVINTLPFHRQDFIKIPSSFFQGTDKSGLRRSDTIQLQSVDSTTTLARVEASGFNLQILSLSPQWTIEEPTVRRDEYFGESPLFTPMFLLGVNGFLSTQQTFQTGASIHSPTSQGSLFAHWESVGRIPTIANTQTSVFIYPPHVHERIVLDSLRFIDKGAIHIAIPFDIPNATVRIGISDTCVTPESGRIPGSNNDFFCVQRWIDVSNDSMGVTLVCPQGALWEVGDMVDERQTVPGQGKDPQYYKAWKREAHSSSTIYLYALNNYWHTNFKADQEGPITYDIYLKMHGPFKLEDARRFGLEMTRPLITWWK